MQSNQALMTLWRLNNKYHSQLVTLMNSPPGTDLRDRQVAALHRKIGTVNAWLEQFKKQRGVNYGYESNRPNQE